MVDKSIPQVSSSGLIDRDISWLAFNHRVLQEAKDNRVPLFERIKFLAIYSSNLGEFFRVRVASHRNLIRVGKKTKKKLDYQPTEVIKEILSIVTSQMKEFSRIFDEEIIPELKNSGIRLLKRKEMNQEQKEFIAGYFMDNMLPFCQPVLLFEDAVKPFLNDAELYLVLDLRRINEENNHYYGMVKIPSDHLPRFIELPSQEGVHDIIMLDDVVRQNASRLFPGFKIEDSYSIKLTRDAELYIDDEYSGNLLQKIKKSLQKRNVGPASRLVYDVNMPKRMLRHLSLVLDLVNSDLIPESKYHNNFDFFTFPDFNKDHLKDEPLPPLPSPLETKSELFKALEKKDYFLHVPYQSYESLIKFFEKAAKDPHVTHIKIVQYRVAKVSRIMDALKRACKNGKKVFVFIEVKARFDEEANLRWGEQLESSGIKVRYSFPGLKVHSKVALVRRSHNGEAKLFAYLSTGNFHEKTAKLYSDMGIFTTDNRITREVARLFTFLETVKIPRKGFEHLLVGQFNLFDHLVKLIKKEIKNAKEGIPAAIWLKLNSLQDPAMIDLLYEAKEAGVELRLIVRGIFCMKVAKKEFNDSFKAISIVDRFLEHSRIYMFGVGNSRKIYLSSADWMIRNLHHRIETAFPIYDKKIHKEIIKLFEKQWKDNVKARYLDESLNNEYVTNDKAKFQSQIETYDHFKLKINDNA